MLLFFFFNVIIQHFDSTTDILLNSISIEVVAEVSGADNLKKTKLATAGNTGKKEHVSWTNHEAFSFCFESFCCR